MFGWFLMSALIGFTVGYIIDEMKGGLWGLFLGPIGWLIAAITKDKSAKVTTSGGAREATSPSEYEKWEVLKGVDDDIMAASKRINLFAIENGVNAATLEKKVAANYFTLNDKTYLGRIIDNVLSEPLAALDKKVIIDAAGGRKIELNLNSEGKYVAATLSGSLKTFETIEDAKDYFG